MRPTATPLRRLWRGDMAPVLLVASLLLALRCVLALTLIPPWQQPDEPSHVALAELHRSRIALLDGAPDPAREREILLSMASHDWWTHRSVGEPMPVPTPESFSKAARLDRRGFPEVLGIEDPPAYFRVVGRLLSWLPRLTITGDLYILRSVSALFGMLTLGVAWLAAREFAGPVGAGVVTLLLALNFPFAVLSTAATPDAMTNFLGACLWWQAAAVMRTQSVVQLLLVWLIAIAAAAADRMGIPLVLVALVVSAGVLMKRPRPRPGRAAVALGATAVLGVGALGAIAWVLQAFGETYGWNRAFSALVPVEGAMSWERLIGFNWQLYRSWWFSLGWGRYTAPAWFVSVTVVITVVAALGVARRFFDRSRLTPPSPALMTLALVGIAIQLFAIHWTYFRLAGGAQGRYLFPFLVPSLVLMWAGVETWVPPSQRVHAAAALVLLVGLLDVAVWTVVALPAYYASL